MKTKNSKIFLSILTLILCVGVMITGIYSLPSATLNIGGTLGFTMHNAVVEVTGTIYNIAQKDAEGYIKADQTIKKTTMGADSSETTNNLSLGDLEFYKKTPMIFSLTFRNLSEQRLVAIIDKPNLGTNVRFITSGEYDSMPTTKNLSVDGTTTLYFALE